MIEDVTLLVVPSIVILEVTRRGVLADSIIYATAKQLDATVWTMDADFVGSAGVRYVPKRK